VALDDATLLYIPADDFTQLVRTPEVSQQFVRMLAGRLDQQDAQLLGLAYSSLRKRLQDMLLHLHAQQFLLVPADLLIQLARQDMAALIGTTPESPSRILSEFRSDESIELTPRFIKVLQPSKLRRSNW
jgi:CRP-like cAMP-binding protein